VYSGHADVIVCDGFTGNVALKVSESLAGAIEGLLEDELSRTLAARAGFLLARRAFGRFRRRLDYAESGGAPLVGVAGLCVIGHGRSGARAIGNGIALAYRLAASGFVDRIAKDIQVAH
jgi:glycerol-3-phosphate acyltransferase PlsX